MGNSISTREDIAVRASRIQSEANAILKSLSDQGIKPNDVQGICSRVALTYRNSLQQFNKNTIAQVVYNIGLIPPAADLQQVDKQNLCAIITAYYQKKFELLQYIQQYLEGSCEQVRKVVISNVDEMLAEAPANVRRTTQRRLQQLDEAVQRLFADMETAVNFVASEDLSPEVLDKGAQRAFQQLNADVNQCCRRAHALRQFALEPVIVQGRKKYRNMYNNNIVLDSVPKITALEREFSVAELQAAGICQ